MKLKRPMPPENMRGEWRLPELFTPAPDVEQWIRATFLQQTSKLFNDDHSHLEFAKLGVLWTNVGNSRQANLIVGTAEMVNPKGGTWQRKRQEFQLEQWFGEKPDFVITFDSCYAAVCNDVAWCALVEHELYHCGWAVHANGSRRIHRDGTPIFALKPHDVEEFVGVVRRYGSNERVQELVHAAMQKPSIGLAAVEEACCGTCKLKVA